MLKKIIKDLNSKFGIILKQTSWAFASKGVGFVLFYSLQFYLMRSMPVETWGEWSVFFSLLNIVLLSSNMGINASSKKHIAQFRNTNELKSVIKSAFRLRFLVTGIYIILVLIFHKTILNYYGFSRFQELFFYSLPLIFLFSFKEFLKTFFEGFYKLKYNFIINFLEHGLKLLFVIIFFYFFQKFTSIIVAFTFANSIAVLVALVLVFYFILRNLKSVSIKRYEKDIFIYSLPIILASTGAYVSTEIDVIMLNSFTDNFQTGIYSTAKQIVAYLPHISLAIGMGIMPLFAKLNEDNYEELFSKFMKVFKINILIYLIIIASILILSKWTIFVILGEDYVLSYWPLILLMPFVFFNSLSHFTSSFMVYRGLARKRTLNLLISVLLNIVLNYLFIPIWGANGAALATSLAYIPYFTLNLIDVLKDFRKVKAKINRRNKKSR